MQIYIFRRLIVHGCVVLRGKQGQRHVNETDYKKHKFTLLQSQSYLCSTRKTSRWDMTLVRWTRSDLVWARMWSYDAIPLVHFYIVKATCCRMCTHGATTPLSLILSLRPVWIRATDRSDNDFHKINDVTGGELLRRLVPATKRCHLSPPSVSRP